MAYFWLFRDMGRGAERERAGEGEREFIFVACAPSPQAYHVCVLWGSPGQSVKLFLLPSLPSFVLANCFLKSFGLTAAAKNRPWTWREGAANLG